MNMLNVDDMKWIEDSVEDVKKIAEKVNFDTKEIAEKEEVIETPTGAMAKMKAFVKKAVDCCIE